MAVASPLLDQYKHKTNKSVLCPFGAPLIALSSEAGDDIIQGCCNHWTCPTCQMVLAGYHRHKMKEGAALLLEVGPIYFITITCRGRDLDTFTMDDEYYGWTNRLLTACRTKAKRAGQRWVYVQVTERQQRGAAHSHLISTWLPPVTNTWVDKKGRTHYSSTWLEKLCVKAGLGPQCTITLIVSAGAVAVYVSKYLEKQLNTDVWPAHWRRIRYSRDWPKTETTFDIAQPLLKLEHWRKIDTVGIDFVAGSWAIWHYAAHRMRHLLTPESGIVG